LQEINFGAWTGKPFTALAGDSVWRRFNSFRSGARIPEGESMLEAQTRFVNELQELSTLHPGSSLGIVSHADLIKAGLAYLAGIPLDLFQRIEISTGSVSIVELSPDGVRILAINECCARSKRAETGFLS
jgi:probable phosphoglycerate mutase